MARSGKKLSKSEPLPPEFEVSPHDRKDGTRIWLWACMQGCYDPRPYDRSSPDAAERAAREHIAKPHS